MLQKRKLGAVLSLVFHPQDKNILLVTSYYKNLEALNSIYPPFGFFFLALFGLPSSSLFVAPFFSPLPYCLLPQFSVTFLYLFVVHLCLFSPVLLASVPLFSATFLPALDLLLSIHFPFPLFVRSKIWLASLKFAFLAHLLVCI